MLLEQVPIALGGSLLALKVGPRSFVINVAVVNPACPAYTAINSFSKARVATNHE